MSSQRLFSVTTDQGYYIKVTMEHTSKQVARGHVIVQNDYVYCIASNADGTCKDDITVQFGLSGPNLSIECAGESDEYVLGISFKDLNSKLEYTKKKDHVALYMFEDKQKTLFIDIENEAANKDNTNILSIETFPTTNIEPEDYSNLRANCQITASTFVKAVKAMKKSKVKKIRLHSFSKGILMTDCNDDLSTAHKFGKVPIEFIEWLNRKKITNVTSTLVSVSPFNIISEGKNEECQVGATGIIGAEFQPLTTMELDTATLIKLDKCAGLAPTSKIGFYLYPGRSLMIESNIGAQIGKYSTYIRPASAYTTRSS